MRGRLVGGRGSEVERVGKPLGLKAHGLGIGASHSEEREPEPACRGSGGYVGWVETSSESLPLLLICPAVSGATHTLSCHPLGQRRTLRLRRVGGSPKVTRDQSQSLNPSSLQLQSPCSQWLCLSECYQSECTIPLSSACCAPPLTGSSLSASWDSPSHVWTPLSRTCSPAPVNK